MRTPYYREQALEGIAREVITAYDPNLYYGVPRMIPIEDIIEAQGITLEYQCLRKTGCVLGETIFDDGGAIIYDYDTVKEIAPHALQPEHLRVAAYCRVSSDSEDQLHSYAAQIRNYTEVIAQHDGWELVDVYADEAVIIGLKTLRLKKC